MMIGRDTSLLFTPVITGPALTVHLAWDGILSGQQPPTSGGRHPGITISSVFWYQVGRMAGRYSKAIIIPSPSLQPPSSDWISWKDRIFSSLWSRPTLGQFRQCSPLITVWPYPGQILINPPSRSAFVELFNPQPTPVHLPNKLLESSLPRTIVRNAVNMSGTESPQYPSLLPAEIVI